MQSNINNYPCSKEESPKSDSEAIISTACAVQQLAHIHIFKFY